LRQGAGGRAVPPWPPRSQEHLAPIPRKRIYTDDFDWDGVTYSGRHEALVSRETCRVQTLIDKRVETRQHRIRHDFAFTGFVRCGHCGCQPVGELKKGKYVYYHCTGHHGKCAEPYTREEVMQDQLAASLRELVVPCEILAWLNATVSESDLTERASREREIARLEEQRRRLDSKLDAMYEDRLEGRITPEMYDRKASDLRGQSLALSRRIDEIRAAALRSRSGRYRPDGPDRPGSGFICRSAHAGEAGFSQADLEIGNMAAGTVADRVRTAV
jgi:site-specific DNA recombinase